MSTIKVRVAEQKDIPSLARIHVETWQCAYKGQVPDEYLNSLSVTTRTQKWREIVDKQEEGTQTFVAEVDNQVVGFCFVGYCRDEDQGKDTGELWSIYIDAKFMIMGVGSSLMNEAIKFFKSNGYKKATLWVLDTNAKSRKWYENRGWKVEGLTKVEPRDGFSLNEVRYVIEL